jgi:hypothetical protein
MNNLYKTAQALQLTSSKKVSTDRRQEEDDDSFRLQKGTPQNQPNCATTCAPHPPPHLCTTVLSRSFFCFLFWLRAMIFQRGRRKRKV